MRVWVKNILLDYLCICMPYKLRVDCDKCGEDSWRWIDNSNGTNTYECIECGEGTFEESSSPPFGR